MPSDHLTWKKSSRSSTYNNCVEVAFAGADVLTRDSKHPHKASLRFTGPTWRRFLDSLREGKHDNPSPS